MHIRYLTICHSVELGCDAVAAGSAFNYHLLIIALVIISDIEAVICVTTLTISITIKYFAFQLNGESLT